MILKSLPAVIVFLIMWSGKCLAAPIAIESSFDYNIEGWGRIGDSGSSLRYSNSNGNPDGYIYIQDAAAGITDWFIAPNKFHGDLSEFLNGVFSFDIRLSNVSNLISGQPIATIMGIGGELQTTLEFADLIGDIRAGQWITLQFQLTPDDWLLGGKTASLAEFTSILSSITQIRIRGDWRSGAETVSLDNVRFSGNSYAIPEPSYIGIFSFGLMGLLLFRRKSTNSVPQ